jgi:hypothetical protein
VEKLKNALVAGSKIEGACTYAGIDSSTYQKWKARAKKDMDEGKTTEYVHFFMDITRAIDMARPRLEMIVSKAAEEDWKAAAWMLERRHPKDYGRKEYVETKDKTGEPDEIDVSALPDEELLKRAKQIIENRNKGA